MIQDDRVKEIQLKILAIFNEFDSFCEAHNLRYFAISGTAIGAVREKGIIPWDDDIDVAMPRRDYEKLVKLSNRLSSHLRFEDLTREPYSPIMSGKISDARTTYMTESQVEMNHFRGVFIDIMPMDGVPELKILYIFHMLWLKALYKINTAVSLSNSNLTLYSKSKKILLYCVKFLDKIGILNAQRLKILFINSNKKYDFDDSKYLARTWRFRKNPGMQTSERYFRADFSTTIKFDFDGTMIRVPIGYDRYLNSLYPGYMERPALDQQQPRHGGGLIDLNRPSSFYSALNNNKLIGYVPGTFDMFHIGHLRILEKAKVFCDHLIVGVNSDSLVLKNKGKSPVVPQEERIKILEALSMIDEVQLINTSDKNAIQRDLQFNIMFVGSDYLGKLEELENNFLKNNISIKYFDYTNHTSSTKLRNFLDAYTE